MSSTFYAINRLAAMSSVSTGHGVTGPHKQDAALPPCGALGLSRLEHFVLVITGSPNEMGLAVEITGGEILLTAALCGVEA